MMKTRILDRPIQNYNIAVHLTGSNLKKIKKVLDKLSLIVYYDNIR